MVSWVQGGRHENISREELSIGKILVAYIQIPHALPQSIHHIVGILLARNDFES